MEVGGAGGGALCTFTECEGLAEGETTGVECDELDLVVMVDGETKDVVDFVKVELGLSEDECEVVRVGLGVLADFVDVEDVVEDEGVSAARFLVDVEIKEEEDTNSLEEVAVVVDSCVDVDLASVSDCVVFAARGTIPLLMMARYNYSELNSGRRVTANSFGPKATSRSVKPRVGQTDGREKVR